MKIMFKLSQVIDNYYHALNIEYKYFIEQYKVLKKEDLDNFKKSKYVLLK